MTAKKAKKLDGARLVELLSSVTTSTGPGCFYSRAPEAAREFLDACAAVKKEGRLVSGAKVSEVLGREFKFQIGENAIRRHLAGACQCNPKK